MAGEKWARKGPEPLKGQEEYLGMEIKELNEGKRGKKIPFTTGDKFISGGHITDMQHVRNSWV